MRLPFCVYYGLALLLGTPLLSGKLNAQASCSVPLGGTCSTSASVNMTVGTVVQLDQPSITVSLGASGAADYITGYKATTGPSLTIKSNAAWSLNARASTSVWTASNTSPGVSARATKPAHDLRWSLTPAGSFTGFTGSNAKLTSGTATAGTTQTVHFQTLYNWSLDTPGAYSLGVVFTLASP